MIGFMGLHLAHGIVDSKWPEMGAQGPQLSSTQNCTIITLRLCDFFFFLKERLQSSIRSYIRTKISSERKLEMILIRKKYREHLTPQVFLVFFTDKSGKYNIGKGMRCHESPNNFLLL
jgi:hypothetical protein